MFEVCFDVNALCTARIMSHINHKVIFCSSSLHSTLLRAFSSIQTLDQQLSTFYFFFGSAYFPFCCSANGKNTSDEKKNLENCLRWSVLCVFLSLFMPCTQFVWLSLYILVFIGGFIVYFQGIGYSAPNFATLGLLLMWCAQRHRF